MNSPFNKQKYQILKTQGNDYNFERQNKMDLMELRRNPNVQKHFIPNQYDDYRKSFHNYKFLSQIHQDRERNRDIMSQNTQIFNSIMKIQNRKHNNSEFGLNNLPKTNQNKKRYPNSQHQHLNITDLDMLENNHPNQDHQKHFSPQPYMNYGHNGPIKNPPQSSMGYSEFDQSLRQIQQTVSKNQYKMPSLIDHLDPERNFLYKQLENKLENLNTAVETNNNQNHQKLKNVTPKKEYEADDRSSNSKLDNILFETLRNMKKSLSNVIPPMSEKQPVIYPRIQNNNNAPLNVNFQSQNYTLKKNHQENQNDSIENIDENYKDKFPQFYKSRSASPTNFEAKQNNHSQLEKIQKQNSQQQIPSQHNQSGHIKLPEEEEHQNYGGINNETPEKKQLNSAQLLGKFQSNGSTRYHGFNGNNKPNNSQNLITENTSSPKENENITGSFSNEAMQTNQSNQSSVYSKYSKHLDRESFQAPSKKSIKLSASFSQNNSFHRNQIEDSALEKYMDRPIITKLKQSEIQEEEIKKSIKEFKKRFITVASGDDEVSDNQDREGMKQQNNNHSNLVVPQIYQFVTQTQVNFRKMRHVQAERVISPSISSQHSHSFLYSPGSNISTVEKSQKKQVLEHKYKSQRLFNDQQNASEVVKKQSENKHQMDEKVNESNHLRIQTNSKVIDDRSFDEITLLNIESKQDSIMSPQFTFIPENEVRGSSHLKPGISDIIQPTKSLQMADRIDKMAFQFPHDSQIFNTFNKSEREHQTNVPQFKTSQLDENQRATIQLIQIESEESQAASKNSKLRESKPNFKINLKIPDELDKLNNRETIIQNELGDDQIQLNTDHNPEYNQIHQDKANFHSKNSNVIQQPSSIQQNNNNNQAILQYAGNSISNHDNNSQNNFSNNISNINFTSMRAQDPSAPLDKTPNQKNFQNDNNYSDFSNNNEKIKNNELSIQSQPKIHLESKPPKNQKQTEYQSGHDNQFDMEVPQKSVNNRIEASNGILDEPKARNHDELKNLDLQQVLDQRATRFLSNGVNSHFMSDNQISRRSIPSSKAEKDRRDRERESNNSQMKSKASSENNTTQSNKLNPSIRFLTQESKEQCLQNLNNKMNKLLENEVMKQLQDIHNPETELELLVLQFQELVKKMRDVQVSQRPQLQKNMDEKYIEYETQSNKVFGLFYSHLHLQLRLEEYIATDIMRINQIEDQQNLETYMKDIDLLIKELKINIQVNFLMNSTIAKKLKFFIDQWSEVLNQFIAKMKFQQYAIILMRSIDNQISQNLCLNIIENGQFFQRIVEDINTQYAFLQNFGRSDLIEQILTELVKSLQKMQIIYTDEIEPLRLFFIQESKGTLIIDNDNSVSYLFQLLAAMEKFSEEHSEIFDIMEEAWAQLNLPLNWFKSDKENLQSEIIYIRKIYENLHFLRFTDFRQDQFLGSLHELDQTSMQNQVDQERLLQNLQLQYLNEFQKVYQNIQAQNPIKHVINSIIFQDPIFYLLVFHDCYLVEEINMKIQGRGLSPDRLSSKSLEILVNQEARKKENIRYIFNSFFDLYNNMSDCDENEKKHVEQLYMFFFSDQSGDFEWVQYFQDSIEFINQVTLIIIGRQAQFDTIKDSRIPFYEVLAKKVKLENSPLLSSSPQDRNPFSHAKIQKMGKNISELFQILVSEQTQTFIKEVYELLKEFQTANFTVDKAEVTRFQAKITKFENQALLYLADRIPNYFQVQEILHRKVKDAKQLEVQKDSFQLFAFMVELQQLLIVFQQTNLGKIEKLDIFNHFVVQYHFYYNKIVDSSSAFSLYLVDDKGGKSQEQKVLNYINMLLSQGQRQVPLYILQKSSGINSIASTQIKAQNSENFHKESIFIFKFENKLVLEFIFDMQLCPFKTLRIEFLPQIRDNNNNDQKEREHVSDLWKKPFQLTRDITQEQELLLKLEVNNLFLYFDIVAYQHETKEKKILQFSSTILNNFYLAFPGCLNPIEPFKFDFTTISSPHKNIQLTIFFHYEIDKKLGLKFIVVKQNKKTSKMSPIFSDDFIEGDFQLDDSQFISLQKHQPGFQTWEIFENSAFKQISDDYEFILYVYLDVSLFIAENHLTTIQVLRSRFQTFQLFLYSQSGQNQSDLSDTHLHQQIFLDKKNLEQLFQNTSQAEIENKVLRLWTFNTKFEILK